MHEIFFLLIKEIGKAEEIPQEWHLAVMEPILSAAYKIFSGVLHLRLMKYAQKILGEYWFGFRSNRSTVAQVHLIRKILEMTHEFDINLHNLFVDFKQGGCGITSGNKCFDVCRGINSKLLTRI